MNTEISISRKPKLNAIHTLLLYTTVTSFQTSFSQQSPIAIEVNTAKTVGEMKPFWAFFGYDEPNFTTREDGKKLLKELKALSSATVYVRTHNLLTSKGNSIGPDLKWGFTNAYKEDPSGNPVYSWEIVDSIIDTYIQDGIKPLMEIGFMPKDFSSKPEPYEHTCLMFKPKYAPLALAFHMGARSPCR